MNRKLTDKVRRVVEEDGAFLVSFPSKNGYFKVPEKNLQARIRTAMESQQDISLTYDSDLNILTID
jgi:hypothetical protein